MRVRWQISLLLGEDLEHQGPLSGAFDNVHNKPGEGAVEYSLSACL